MTNFVVFAILFIAVQIYLADSFGVSNAGATPRVIRSMRTLEMKKGRNKVPIEFRGEYVKQQRAMEAQKQMMSSRPKGVPIFQIFARGKAGSGPWIPVGDLAGDQRATALVNAWMSGFLPNLYKSQIDRGVARSLFTQEDSFVNGLIQNFRPFKKYTKEDLEFGFKVIFEGLEEKLGEQSVSKISPEMQKGWFDNIKESFAGVMSQYKGDDESKDD